MLASARTLIRSAASRPAASAGAVRFLNVHEYISMELMQSHGITTPESHVAETPEEAEHIYNSRFKSSK